MLAPNLQRKLQAYFDRVWAHFVVNKGPLSARLNPDYDTCEGFGAEVNCLYKGPLLTTKCAHTLFEALEEATEERVKNAAPGQRSNWRNNAKMLERYRRGRNEQRS